jgi:hypothetical protein
MAKDFTGSIKVNPRKESDRHPDYKGSCTIDGIQYWISGWMKESSDGESWTSLAFTKKDVQQ